MKTRCPSCGKEFEIQVRESNKFGFAVGSKGDAISSLIEKRGVITMFDISAELEKQYAGENNTARIQQVVYQLKKNGFVYTDGAKITLVTPELKAKALAPKAKAAKVSKPAVVKS